MTSKRGSYDSGLGSDSMPRFHPKAQFRHFCDMDSRLCSILKLIKEMAIRLVSGSL